MPFLLSLVLACMRSVPRRKLQSEQKWQHAIFAFIGLGVYAIGSSRKLQNGQKWEHAIFALVGLGVYAIGASKKITL